MTATPEESQEAPRQLGSNPEKRPTAWQLALVIGFGFLALTLSALAAWWLRGRWNAVPAAPDVAAVSPPGKSNEIERGRLLYRTYCSGCNGQEGHGDGPTATTLQPTSE